MEADGAVAERHRPHPLDQRQTLLLSEPLAQPAGILDEAGPALLLGLRCRRTSPMRPSPHRSRRWDSDELPVRLGQRRIRIGQLQNQQRRRLPSRALRDVGPGEERRPGGVERFLGRVPHPLPLPPPPPQQVPDQPSGQHENAVAIPRVRLIPVMIWLIRSQFEPISVPRMVMPPYQMRRRERHRHERSQRAQVHQPGEGGYHGADAGKKPADKDSGDAKTEILPLDHGQRSRREQPAADAWLRRGAARTAGRRSRPRPLRQGLTPR